MKSAGTDVNSVKIAAWADQAQLISAQAFAPGGVVIGEQPIAFVKIEPEQDEQGPWILLDSILRSPAVLKQVIDADLNHTSWELGRADIDTVKQLSMRYKKKPKKIRQLYQQVAANNIRYKASSILGYGIWPMLSRSNHSCAPNTRLVALKNEHLVELLLATRAIAPGEPICWNYFSDEAFTRLDWQERNRRLLHDFQFICRCTRCEFERPGTFDTLTKTQQIALLSARTD